MTDPITRHVRTIRAGSRRDRKKSIFGRPAPDGPHGNSTVSELTPLPVADPVAELQPLEAAARLAPLRVRVVTLVVIAVPFLGLLAAPFFLWGWGFSWVDLGLLLGTYILTALGITVGFHRLFT